VQERSNFETALVLVQTGVGLVAMWWGMLAITIQVLILLMIADIVLGIMAAYVAKSIDPHLCWVGVTKKAMILIIVAVSAVLSKLLSPIADVPVGDAVAGFYAAHELLSILVNAGNAGLPVPPMLKDALAKIAPDVKPPDRRVDGP